MLTEFPRLLIFDADDRGEYLDDWFVSTGDYTRLGLNRVIRANREERKRARELERIINDDPVLALTLPPTWIYDYRPAGIS